MNKATSILILLLFCSPLFSQSEVNTDRKREMVEIYFDQDSYAVDSLYKDNNKNLHKLAQLIDKLKSDSSVISEIKINSYTSPEGGRDYNKKLSERRSDAMYHYLTNVVSIPQEVIRKSNSGVDWIGLATLVEQSDMQYKDEVLHIIESVPEETWRRLKPTDRWMTLVDSRNKHLMDLRYGNPYRYMYDHIYPQLRRASFVSIYFETVAPPTPVVEKVVMADTEAKKADTPQADKPEPVATDTIPTSKEAVAENIVDEGIASEGGDNETKSIKFALKTNLLYDVLLTPNVELEVPIGRRWSVAGEWIFPWWVTKNNGNALQILSGQLEGRYWLGNREERPYLTGWYGAFYAGGGLYDLQWKNNGYQGEFYIAAGLAAGYAHTINKRGNLRLEYSLGIGYLATEYRYYEGKQDNEYLVWQHDGKYRWLGPTKAEVSLVWFIDWQRGGKR